MTSVKQVVVCKLHQRIWICSLCVMCVLVGTLQASAQIRPLWWKHRIIGDLGAAEKKNVLKADIGASLKDIARRMTR